ncbi:MAG: right-handed parallel beta-helix repeat-containing protein [Deltaproteobacteria bacterium]|nr:right-handed parallel beta-helix repeat-containing protein [Deltaproteobacteria bacterium]
MPGSAARSPGAYRTTATFTGTDEEARLPSAPRREDPHRAHTVAGSGSTIIGCTAARNGSSFGSSAISASYAVVRDNVMEGNQYHGITCLGCTITGNTVASNGGCGIQDPSSSTVVGNTAIFNASGLCLDDGGNSKAGYGNNVLNDNNGGNANPAPAAPAAAWPPPTLRPPRPVTRPVRRHRRVHRRAEPDLRGDHRHPRLSLRRSPLAAGRRPRPLRPRPAPDLRPAHAARHRCLLGPARRDRPLRLPVQDRTRLSPGRACPRQLRVPLLDDGDGAATPHRRQPIHASPHRTVPPAGASRARGVAPLRAARLHCPGPPAVPRPHLRLDRLAALPQLAPHDGPHAAAVRARRGARPPHEPPGFSPGRTWESRPREIPPRAPLPAPNTRRSTARGVAAHPKTRHCPVAYAGINNDPPAKRGDSWLGVALPAS